MSKAHLDKRKVDVSQAFLMYMACMGDCERVAIALELEPAQVRALADEEGWPEKIRRISVISRSGRPGDFERAQNRAICFVQAACIRQQINRLLHQVSEMTGEELMSRACVRTRDGGMQLSAKFMTDMANAAEACHRMTYMSLGDTVTERQENAEGGGGKGSSSNDLHAAIIASLSNPIDSPKPAIELLAAEAEEEMRSLATAKLPDSPPVSIAPQAIVAESLSEARADMGER